MRKSFMAMAALGGAIAVQPAAAADYDFSYGFGGTTFASGVISTDESQDCGAGCFVISNVTGKNRGQDITGYDYFDLTGSQVLYPGSPSFVDGGGLTYYVGTTSYNIFSTGGFYSEFHFDTASGEQIGSSQFITSFTLSPHVAAAVPEPATWATMLIGFGGIGFAMRRRNAARVAVAFA